MASEPDNTGGRGWECMYFVCDSVVPWKVKLAHSKVTSTSLTSHEVYQVFSLSCAAWQPWNETSISAHVIV